MRSAIFTLAVAVSLLEGCTHAVHSLDVEPAQKARIEQALLLNCSGRCELVDCWRETETLTVCDAEFSFTIDSSKFVMIQRAAQTLEKENLKVGFCGTDSVATHFVGAFIGGIASGAASAATGSGSSYMHVSTGSYGVSSEAAHMAKACSSTPVGPSKPNPQQRTRKGALATVPLPFMR